MLEALSSLLGVVFGFTLMAYCQYRDKRYLAAVIVSGLLIAAVLYIRMLYIQML